MSTPGVIMSLDSAVLLAREIVQVIQASLDQPSLTLMIITDLISKKSQLVVITLVS